MNTRPLMRRLRHSPVGDWVAAIALAAFLVRGLIPIGFMPASDGAFGLMVCSGVIGADALMSRDVMPSKDAMPHSGGSHAGMLCPFAILHASAEPPDLCIGPVPAARIAAYWVSVSGYLPPALSGSPRSQFSRGPPARS